MAIFDVSAFEAALKIKYGPRLVSQVNDKVTALKLFSKDSESWEGLRVQFPVQVGRGQSFMAHGSLGLLPTPENETTYEVQIPVRWIRGRIQFGVDIMKQSMKSRAAFARANTMLMDRLVANLADERNRMLSAGTGTGVLALVDDSTSVGSSADPLEVDAPGGIASDVFGTRYLQKGMLIAFTNGTTIRGIRKITDIKNETSATPGIVLDNTVQNGVQYADNDYIVRVANASVTNLTRDTSYNNEPMGLEGIVDDGTLVNVFHNINRTNVPDWQATRLSVSALSLDALQRLEDTIDQQCGEEPTDYLVHHSVRRAYLALVDASRVFMQTGKAGEFDLGQREMGKLTYNGKPIHTDKDVQLGTWFALNKAYLTHYVLVEGEWADETGSMFRAVPGQDALEAIYRVAENYSSEKPNAHGKLVGMSTSNAIARHVV